VTGGASFSSTEGVVDSTNYMVQFNMPIYQGGGVQSRVRQAYNNRAKAVQEVEAQQRRIIRETRAAYRKVLSGIKKVQALKHSIISQQSALDVKSKGLKAGVNTLLEVLDAQRELYYAQTDYSQSRYDYLLATLKLRQATGSLTETDLQEINDLVN
jgi:outer membrane protein